MKSANVFYRKRRSAKRTVGFGLRVFTEEIFYNRDIDQATDGTSSNLLQLEGIGYPKMFGCSRIFDLKGEFAEKIVTKPDVKR